MNSTQISLASLALFGLLLIPVFRCDAADSISFRAADIEYKIPKRALLTGPSQPWLPTGIAPSSDQELNLVFPADGLRSEIPAWLGGGDLVATIKPNRNSQNREAAESRHIQDVWLGNGRFKNPQLSKTSDGLYRLYTGQKLVFWELVRTAPNPSEPVPPTFWIASCLIAPSHRPVEQSRCETTATVDGILLQFSIQERDAINFPALRALLVKQIRSWRVDQPPR